MPKQHFPISHICRMFDLLIERSPSEDTAHYLKTEYDEFRESVGLRPKSESLSKTAFEKISV